MKGSFLLLVIFLRISSLQAQESGVEESEDLSINDSRTNWTVGFTILKGVELSNENIYLVNSIPLLLKEKLSSIRSHFLSVEERQAHEERLLNEKYRQYSERVSALQDRRTNLIFDMLDTSFIDSQIIHIQDKLSKLSMKNAIDLKVPENKPIFFSQPSDSDPLYSVPSFSMISFAREQDLDFLVTGTVEEVEGFLFFEISAADTNLNQIVFVYQDALNREKVEETVSSIVNSLADIILGEPWSTITVNPDPVDSIIFIDGVFVGSGYTVIPFLRLGEHVVSVLSPKYRSRDLVVNLGPSEMLLSIRLEELLTQRIKIISEPTGAMLYIDSVYQGLTPTFVEITDKPVRLVAQYEGYYHLETILNSGVESPLELRLSKFSGNREVIQQEFRDQFYHDLGNFVVSLVLPLFMVGWTSDLTQQANAIILDGGSASKLIANRELLIGGGIVASLVSVVFLLIAGQSLDNYIGSADP